MDWTAFLRDEDDGSVTNASGVEAGAELSDEQEEAVENLVGRITDSEPEPGDRIAAMDELSALLEGAEAEFLALPAGPEAQRGGWRRRGAQRAVVKCAAASPPGASAPRR
jgi:hypothetical protein